MFCRLDDSARALVAKAAEQMAPSASAYYRVLKVARTIGDLDGATNVARIHAAEALTYRCRPAMAARMGASAIVTWFEGCSEPTAVAFIEPEVSSAREGRGLAGDEADGDAAEEAGAGTAAVEAVEGGFFL